MSEWDNVPIREVVSTITLTKKEVEGAREEHIVWRYQCFFEYDVECADLDEAQCHLCKKLTEFARGGEDE